MRPDLDDEGIRRYLLGLLADEETAALEEEYLGRPEVLDRVRAVEDDLLDDYAADRLGPDERTLFERRYLASSRLQERVVAARALRLASLRRLGSTAERPFDARAAARRTRWRGPLAMAAGLLLAVLALSLWRLGEPKVAIAPTPPPSITPPLAPPPSPGGGLEPSVSPSSGSPRPGPAALTRVAFALSPVLLRGPEGPRELRVRSGIATVVLELLGDPALRPASSARLAVEIRTVEGARVWTGRPRWLHDAARPALLAAAEVPAGRLMAGDYLLTLSSGDDVLHRYFFRMRTD
jgi:hypothetical protein